MWWEKVVTSFLFIGPVGVGALWSNIIVINRDKCN